MTNPYSLYSLGDQAVSLEFEGSEIDLSLHEALLAMKRWVEGNSFAGFQDVILGYRSLSITYNPSQVANSGVSGSISEFVKEKLKQAHLFAIGNKSKIAPRQIRVPVCYDKKFALDIDTICQRNKISIGELIKIHTSISYNVYLIGFLPGFPYLGFVDPRLDMPRHPSPRPFVPAGSVGIAGKQTGIYPFDSPGGWQIIGRTPMKLFDPTANPPVQIEAGDLVTFYSIAETDFDHFQSQPQ
jgi:inhibitor of KinA